MRRPLLLALALLSLPFACTTRGSGVAATETRELAGFDAIEVDGAIVLRVEVDPAKPTAVAVQGDDNVVPLVRTTLGQGVLHIELPAGIITTELPLVVTITTPALHGVDVDGASTAHVRGIRGDRFEVEVSGASTVELQGEVEALRAEVSGASTLQAAELSARTAEIETAGASNAEVLATGTLEAEASGASTIRHHGPASVLRQDASGASTIAAAG